ncbi:MAG TPA: glutathione S-transferase family protein [Methylovirgula sp.]|nr:glutathione S-transferase family protein [Methylovirgula sp.]
MTLTLVIANKAYSSWSFRPWILLRHFGIPFEEVVVPLAQETTREQILRYSPAAKCPVLIDGETRVWESLAIIEYVADAHPELAIWPKEKAARALARSLSSEMHAGFQSLRSHLPTHFRRQVSKRELTPEAAADVARIEAAWSDARSRFGKGGDFLFGAFCAADAMFAPVVSRLHTYDAPVTAASRTYMDKVMALPAWRAWLDGADAEAWHIAKYEV